MNAAAITEAMGTNAVHDDRSPLCAATTSGCIHLFYPLRRPLAQPAIWLFCRQFEGLAVLAGSDWGVAPWRPGIICPVILALFLLLVALFVVLPVIGMPGWAIISTIIVGFVIGALGRLVVPGRQRVNLLVTFLAGLVGSIVGGFLGSHVLRLGWIGTTLVEIGLAAAVIVFLASPGGRRMVRGR
jgi:uncharacterized membrane protein YeaQ/YmgE (transglycosylase-associated protein family)